MNPPHSRPTWAEIDLKAVEYNLNAIRKLISSGVEIMPVVKANAYGHGIVEISRVLIKNGVKYLGVATVDEAMVLRGNGIKTSILVLGGILKEETDIAIENDITVTLSSYEMLDYMENTARSKNANPRVHVKIDTGMGRLGIWHEEAYDFLDRVSRSETIELEGIYTHFASAGRDKMYTMYQIDSFKNVIKKVKENNISVKYIHAANSIAIVDWEETHINIVRPGILLYGIYPKNTFRKLFDLKPVMSLKTKIVFLKRTPAGRSISYGRTYITERDTKIATIPLGYADGYGRILSNKAEALVRGNLVPIAGKVTMDQTLLDVGKIDDVKVGDEVVLIGEQNGVALAVETVAKVAGTIPYEIVACITARVPRIYKY